MKWCSLILSTSFIVFLSNHFLLLGVQASSKSSESSFTGLTKGAKHGYSDSIQRIKRETTQLNGKGKGKEAGFPAASASKGSRGLRLYVSHSHERDDGESKEQHEQQDTEENSDSLSNESEEAESKEDLYHHAGKRRPKSKSRKSRPFRHEDQKSKKYRQKLKAMQKTVNSLVRKGLKEGNEKKVFKKIAPALEARFHGQKYDDELRDIKRPSRPQESKKKKQNLDDIYKMLRGMDGSESAESSPSKLTGKYTPKSSSQMYQGRKQDVNMMKGLKSSVDESQEYKTKPEFYRGQTLAEGISKTREEGKPPRVLKGRRVNPVATKVNDESGRKSSGGALQTTEEEGRSSRLMKGKRVKTVTTETDDPVRKKSGKTIGKGRSSSSMKGRKVTEVTTQTDDSKEKIAADKPSTTHKSKKIIVIEPGESVEVIRKSDGYKYPIEYVDMSYEDEEDCDEDKENKKKSGKQAGISKNKAVQDNKVK